ncbi:hypothetical protein AJ80_00417 [Polytolypa hystricis UAMH7299]|uniref:Uncharacterized protein n=1 Tax=Polytolypa hystricis (strain UAMH7299) TaxID=1447883 RepID=A0A2B7Z4U8_POLH7|nr:hypothetical protein AJ80_00417 [Polytolypa hystricis UAMH7299]
MLAARDQENLVHAHQTAAAAKPMNQGLRQLQPKTPGNRAPKTPFKIPLNDENNPLAFGGGKRTVKGGNTQNENLLRPGKDGMGDRNAFVTPLGPRNRAPLGMKTTNAKANAFQTPAAPLGTVKPAKTGRRSSTVKKVKQLQPQTQQAKTQPKGSDTLEEVREVEFAHPVPKPLPDPPEDITYNTDFPQFKGQNFARGWDRLYADEVGEDGLTRQQRDMSDAYDKQIDELIQQQVDNMELLDINVRQFPDEPCVDEIVATTLQEREDKAKASRAERSVSTTKARSAARALSQTSSRTTLVSRPKTTAASRSRLASVLSRPKKQPTPSNPSSMRHTAAAASSRTTVGYTRGRAVSSTLREKSCNRSISRSSSKNILAPEKYMELYGSPPFGSEMWSRCKAAGLFDPEPSDADDIADAVPCIFEEDEESANFQLTL